MTSNSFIINDRGPARAQRAAGRDRCPPALTGGESLQKVEIQPHCYVIQAENGESWFDGQAWTANYSGRLRLQSAQAARAISDFCGGMAVAEMKA